MGNWNDLPRLRLLADVSLWSANLANLEADVAAVSGDVDSFHFDVADGHFAPTLLFFPDLVKTIRPLTTVPFHVHLMVESPSTILPDFLESGANLVTVHAELEQETVRSSLAQIREAGCSCGIALQLETPLTAAVPFLDAVDTILLLGTAIGKKGQELAPAAYDRIRQLKTMLSSIGRMDIRLIADGAIRKHTVPLLRAAGADVIVPGSLVFSNENPVGVLRWLRSVSS